MTGREVLQNKFLTVFPFAAKLVCLFGYGHILNTFGLLLGKVQAVTAIKFFNL